MSKLTLTNLANLQNETTAVSNINSNSTAVEDAIDNTLSRDGTSPNQMQAQLDMNSHRIINLAESVNDSDAINKSELDEAKSELTTLINSISESVVESIIETEVTVVSSPLVSERPPLPGDDTVNGYSVNDHWYNSKSKTLYQNVLNSTSASTWKPLQNNTSLLGDEISGLYGCWGVKQLIAGYTTGANLFEVKRMSDSATQNIVELYNGEADFKNMDNFLGGGYGQVVKAYDQSGNSVNLSLLLAGNPGFTAPYFPTEDGRRGLTSDGWGDNGSNPALGNSSLSFNRQDFCLIIIARVEANGERAILSQMSGADTLMYLAGDGGSALGGIPLSLTVQRGATTTSIPAGPSTQRSMFILNSTASGFQVHVNDVSASTSALPSAVLNQLGIGDAPAVATSAFQLLGEIYAVYLSTGKTANEIETLKQIAYPEWNIVPQRRKQLTLIGDSITASPQLQNKTWSRIVSQSLNPDYTIKNLGAPGATTTTFLSSTFITSLTAAMQAVPQNTVLVWLGTNDIGGAGATAATTFTNLQTLVSRLQVYNDKAVIYVGTMLPRGSDSSVETQRLAYNVLIRNTFADHVIDFAANPTIGAPGSQANTTYYFGDLTHPTSTGSLFIASIVQEALKDTGIIHI